MSTTTYKSTSHKLGNDLARIVSAYKNAADFFLAGLREDKVTSPSGCYNTYVPDELEALLPPDIKELVEEVEQEDRRLLNKLIRPTEEETERAFRAWWKRTHRKKYQDPDLPKPLQLDLTPVRVNQRLYTVGQFQVRLAGDLQYRKWELLLPNGEKGYSNDCYARVKEFPALVDHLVPMIKALHRVGDWNLIVKDDRKFNAAAARSRAIITYYTRNHEDVNSKINRKVEE